MVKHNSVIIEVQAVLESAFGFGEVLNRDFNSKAEYQAIQAEAEEIRATIAAIIEPIRNAETIDQAIAIRNTIFAALENGEL